MIYATSCIYTLMLSVFTLSCNMLERQFTSTFGLLFPRMMIGTITKSLHQTITSCEKAHRCINEQWNFLYSCIKYVSISVKSNRSNLSVWLLERFHLSLPILSNNIGLTNHEVDIEKGCLDCSLSREIEIEMVNIENIKSKSGSTWILKVETVKKILKEYDQILFT